MNSDFVNRVNSEWPVILADVNSDVSNKLPSLLRHLKVKVKAWTKAESLKMKDRSVLLEEEINSLLLSSQSALLSNDQQSRLSSLKVELQIHLNHEISSARLQSRITWALDGDANTKFFHAVASTCKNQNAIWNLKDESGNWVLDDHGLKALGVRHFENYQTPTANSVPL